MPTYTFINQATGDIEDHFMAISELDDFVKTNPQLERVLTAPAIVGSVSIKDKEPQGFKDVMSRIAENNLVQILASINVKVLMKSKQNKF